MFCESSPEKQYSPDKKDRNSNNTAYTDHEFNDTEDLDFQEDVFSRQMRLFSEKVQQGEIGAKLVSKAVNWIQVNAWTKGFDFQSTLLSVAYFYAYYANVRIPKQRLEPILAACLFLSSKIVRRPVLQITDILPLISDQFSAADVLEEENTIAQTLNWDLWLTLGPIQMEKQSATLTQLHKKEFLTQILLLQGISVFYDVEMMMKISVASKENVLAFGLLPPPIKAATKSWKTLINKYNSKFDVEDFLREVQN